VRNADCIDGHCADGVCCDRACNGVCEACNVKDNVGRCIAVDGDPRPGHGACGGAGTTCGKASCDGTAPNECARRPGNDVACEAPSCTGGYARPAGVCDGKGGCARPLATPCHPFACGADRCLARCASSDDCAPGATCDATSGACLQAYRCDRASGERVAPDGVRIACENHLACAEGGACPTQCATRDDCVNGYVCDLHGACIEPKGIVGLASTGCGVARSTGSAGAGWLAWIGAGAFALRRRRARRA
jgi:hypothetical protein